MPVPRLPLDTVLISKDGSTPRQPLTCGSDRSCVTRGNPTNTLLDTPGEGTHPRGSCSALPLPPLPIGAIITQAGAGTEDPQNTEPWTPQSSTGFCTPRNDLSLEKLTLASPRSGSLCTPLGSPMMSPHSPKSPSMMSPMRLVGTRSPCSIKLSGGSSTRLGRDGINMRTSGGTPVFTSPRGQLSAGGSTLATSNNTNTNTTSGMKPGKPSVSRALPFTQPTPAAELSVRQTMERFQIPHLNGRELSFSDLLNPTAKDWVHHRKHTGTTMPLSFVNAGGGGVTAQHPAQIGSAIAANKTRAGPIAAAAGAHGNGNRGGIPTSPVKVAATVPAPAPATYQGSGSGNNNDNGRATPRKRPRKNGTPQRADFGNDDTCGGGSGSGTSMDLNDSSHGETSGDHPTYVNTNRSNALHNNHHNANNNNGFGSMNWDREDGGGHTSPLKKSQHATSTRTSKRRNNNNDINNNGNAAAESDLSGGACVPPAIAPAVGAGNGNGNGKGLHKRDHQ
ncbi:hypothetical protein Ndes2437B_g00047 [Nannochloris sp. 'desiccata']